MSETPKQIQSSIEFTERLVSAYNKFMYVGSASVFVSVLKLSESNSVFGVKVEELNERWLETAFFLASIGLAWNYAARFLDERRVLFDIDRTLQEAKALFSANVEEVSQATDKFSNSVSSYETAVLAVKEIQRRLLEDGKTFDEVMDGVVDRFKTAIYPDPVFMKQGEFEDVHNMKGPEGFSLFRTKLGTAMGDLPQRIGQAELMNASLSEKLERITKKIEEIDTNIHKKKKFTKWGTIRIWSVDVVFPVFLCFALVISYLIPNQTFPFLDWFGEITDLR